MYIMTRYVSQFILFAFCINIILAELLSKKRDSIKFRKLAAFPKIHRNLVNFEFYNHQLLVF